MAMMPGNTLDHGNTLFFRFMRKHGSAHDISDCPYVRYVSAALFIYGDETFACRA